MKKQLSEAELKWIASWPTHATIDGVLAVHASPRNHVLEYIFPHDIKRPGLMKERFDLLPNIPALDLCLYFPAKP